MPCARLPLHNLYNRRISSKPLKLSQGFAKGGQVRRVEPAIVGSQNRSRLFGSAFQPLSHQDYMYTSGDGFVNPLGWSIAHVACKYGDVHLSETETWRPPLGWSRKSCCTCFVATWSMTALPEQFSIRNDNPWSWQNQWNNWQSNPNIRRTALSIFSGRHAWHVHCRGTQPSYLHGRPPRTLRGRGTKRESGPVGRWRRASTGGGD